MRIIKLTCRMNRSFDFVLNSQLNRSRSKEVHAFPKAVRFNKPAVSPYYIDHIVVSAIPMTSPAL